MKRKIIKFNITLLLFTLLSCSINKLPDVIVTSSETAIERQIIGEYKEIEKDAWAISSLKNNLQRNTSNEEIDITDEVLFRSFKIRQYLSIRLREYKSKGYVGENRNGFIEIIKLKNYENNKALKDDVQVLVREENKARNIIFTRSIELYKKSKPSKIEINNFGKIFAKMQLENSLKDDWVQQTDGRWSQVK